MSTGLGPNWRLQFLDEYGQPLSMASFDEVDFGAISYKEIFQNVKTILTTTLFTVPLDRLLGLRTSIVDLPQDAAQQGVADIIDALYQFEPRARFIGLSWPGETSDAIAGHMLPTVQLAVNNVVYGTDTPYPASHAFRPDKYDDLVPAPHRLAYPDLR